MNIKPTDIDPTTIVKYKNETYALGDPEGKSPSSILHLTDACQYSPISPADMFLLNNNDTNWERFISLDGNMHVFVGVKKESDWISAGVIFPRNFRTILTSSFLVKRDMYTRFKDAIWQYTERLDAYLGAPTVRFDIHEYAYNRFQRYDLHIDNDKYRTLCRASQHAYKLIGEYNGKL